MSAADIHRKEEVALDALITASLRCAEAEISEAEVAEFGDPHVVLLPDDEAAIQERSADEIFASRRACQPVAKSQSSVAEENALFMAMNRKNAGDTHSEESQKELDRKRQEILEKLKSRKKPRDTK